VVARKSQYPIKSSTDLHMELMMLFYEAKQASSVVEVGSKSPLQMLEFVWSRGLLQKCKVYAEMSMQMILLM